MTKPDALKALEAMTYTDFNAFLAELPQRTQMLVRSRMCDWREVLPDCYIKTKNV